MPGGGELALVSFGNQNAAFNGNPQETNFYKVYHRQTHFSQESITIPLDGPNELMMDTPVRVRAKIPRHADLLTDLAFVFRVPEMYSKQFGPSGEEYLPAFRWIHALGPLLLDNIAIFVGGSKVQEFPGEWLVARATTDMPTDQFLKWRALVGDIPELHTPEWGIYGKSPSYPFAQGEYPHAVVDACGNLMNPSTPERTIRVPLPFWFTEHLGRALPLIGLQLHEVEVQLTLRPLREIYRIMDPATQRDAVRYGRGLFVDAAKPTSYDPATPTAYDNLTFQCDYRTILPANGAIQEFYTDVGTRVPTQEGFVMNAHLEGTYIYLTEKEQQMFAARELSYLVHQVQTFRFPSITTRTKLELDAHGLTSRLLFYARRSDAIESRNDYLNLSNWKSLSQAPYWPPPVGTPVPNSGVFKEFQQRDCIRSVRLVIAGNELFEEKQAQFFELQTPYTAHVGQGTAGLTPGSGVRPSDIMAPLYCLPFALNASDHFQPSGALNMSRLREIQLEVDPWPLDPDSLYAYDMTVFVESLNILKILNGMGGMAWAV
jgi:hypothetical protein